MLLHCVCIRLVLNNLKFGNFSSKSACGFGSSSSTGPFGTSSNLVIKLGFLLNYECCFRIFNLLIS